MTKARYYDSTVESPPATMQEYYAGVNYRIIIEEVEKAGKGLKILDVGCGEGLLGSFLASNNEVHGVEIYEDKAKRCQDKGIIAKVVLPDQPLPYEDRCFDAVTCSEVLEHLFDPAKKLKEINRVLKNNGLLVATVPNMYDLKTRIKFFFGMKTKLTFGANLGHIRFFSKKSLRKLVEEEGFFVCRNISSGFAHYFRKPFAFLAYLWALVANPLFLKDFRKLRAKKQQIYQNINMFLTNMLGFTSLGGGLVIVAEKNSPAEK